MTYALNKKQMAVAISCVLALGLISGAATAQSNNPTKEGYLIDTRNEVVKSGFGLCWHTGYWTPAQAIEECDPDLVKKPMAQAPAPAPQQLAAVAPPPAPKPAADRVKLNADTLFDFDKAVLRPAGRDALDDFYNKTRDINPEVITAVGHADRFGSDKYNQNLSERRAMAVKTYLMGKGIADNRIYTEGKGEMQPVTKADECKGPKNAKVIACLQPDRRVEIEVIGTRK
ncbi:OmpA family protein [Sulfuritalea sp.]|uniref:OmpA family protein n=1 Tax=Sulfuritalea sp. TaxID=2480090 RepID=UPI00286E0EF2|nr:OmpA family protein [Sulfuritalea sp.]